MKRLLAATSAIALLTAGAAFAHHGWGSYDAAHPVTLNGAILSSKYENPHALVTLTSGDKTWTVTLAPTSRMAQRGVSAQMVGVGKTISAFGYPSNVEKDEMRAERITVEGKTFEMR